MSVEARDNLTPSEELYNKINQDLIAHNEWKSTREEFTRLRLKKNNNRILPYPGAPNFKVPIIDDIINRSVAIQNRVLWQQKFLAFFTPQGPAGYDIKDKVERAFHYLLSSLLEIRRTFSMAFDNRNEMGITYLITTTNDTSYQTIFKRKEILPDIEFLHPYDIIFPADTKRIQNAFRFVRIVKYNRETFRLMGRLLQWKHVDEILRKAQSKDQTANDLGGYHPRINTQNVEITDDQIVVHEGYYHDKNGKKRFVQYAECLPDKPLNDTEWKWEKTNIERRWPVVDLPREDRAPGLYDSRGLAELCADNQNASTALKNVQGQLIDYHGQPMISGGTPLTAGKFLRPGGHLPEGVEINRPVEIPQYFSLLMDVERREAGRRSGSEFGSISSTQSAKNPVTATEVNRNAINADMLILDDVQRFNEPLSTIFSMMWEFLQNNPVSLPVINDNNEFVSELDTAVFEIPFLVRASATAKNSDPVFILNQALSLLQFANQHPNIDQSALFNHIYSQVDPVLADKIVVDTGAGSGVEQMLQQLSQQVEMLTQVVNENRQYIQADAQEREFNEALQDEKRS